MLLMFTDCHPIVNSVVIRLSLMVIYGTKPIFIFSALIPVFSLHPAVVPSLFRSIVQSCHRSFVLSCRRALVQSCSRAVVLSLFRSFVPSCSRAIVLSCPRSFVIRVHFY